MRWAHKWVRSSAYAYAYVAGVLTCLCLCYAYAYAYACACAYAYALVRTGLYTAGRKLSRSGLELIKSDDTLII